MILTGFLAVVLFLRKKLFTERWFQYWCLSMTPAGFIAVLAGWFVTEVGRQPYVVYGLLKTAQVVSPVLGEHILTSLIAFVIVYAFVFGAGLYYICKLIYKGPIGSQTEESFGEHSLQKTAVLAPEIEAEGHSDV